MTMATHTEDEKYKPTSLSPNFYRVVYLCAIGLTAWNHDAIQSVINKLWSYLLTNWFFSSVYFETWWVAVVDIPIIFFPYMADKLSYIDRYKINPQLRWQSPGLKGVLWEIFEYCSPLMILDTFMVKKYHDVDPAMLVEKQQSWIQYTRVLPETPPTVGQLVIQLVFSLVIYDCFFCFLHMTLHKNMWLYKNIHAKHHEHDFVHSRVTNQLSIPERIALVLSANQSLKIMHAHPLTRAIFVIVFVAWLTENHCGYDFPWSLDKVVPFGIIAGPRKHVEHHTKGSRYYQPFFTYIDKYLIGTKVKKQ